MHSEHWIDTIRPSGDPPRRREIAALARFLLRRLGDRLALGLDWLLLCSERAGQRRRLAELSDHMLRDIGLSRADVMAESTKRFWHV